MRKWKTLGIMCFALILPSTVRAQTAPGLNNAALKGNYAFSFNGMTTGDGVTSTPFAAVGRFTADGAGSLSSGELDANGFGAMEKAVAQPFTGTYSIGAGKRGVMSLNIPGGGTLAFAMLANGNAKFVEIDAGGGHGTVGSGTMEKVDTTAYSTAKLLVTMRLALPALTSPTIGRRWPAALPQTERARLPTEPPTSIW